MKSWVQRERALEILSKEVGYVRKPHGNRLRVALAFPNSYWVGMSNLGLQTVYRLFNAHDDIVCERFFLPPKQELAELLATRAPLLTLESQTPVADFDVVAFSVSFEWDYVNVLTLLRLAQIPRLATERNHHHPLDPHRRRRDVRQPRTAGAVRRRHRRRRGRIAGAGVPTGVFRGDRSAATSCGYWRSSAASTSRRSTSRSTPPTARCPATSAAPGAPVPVRKAALRTTEAVDPPATGIFTPDTEFGSRFLIEVVRGCANLCRFCWAGYNYLPVRPFPTDRILELAAAARAHSSKVGLVSIALCDHPDIERILTRLSEMGYSISPASLRLDDLTAADRPHPPGERRAHHHDRTGDRLRPAPTRDQQDRDQRRDPRPRRSHLRERHREPEALLHDRPPHRDGRRSGGDSRPDVAAARTHDEICPQPRHRRPNHRQREPAGPQARHRLPVAADGRPPGRRTEDQAAATA